MKKEDIHLTDLRRILLGDAPWIFMLEVFMRTLIIYLALLLVLRLLGKRMNGQLTITEFAVMVTLGGIVSPIMQLADRGILVGFTSLVCVLVFLRGINWLAFKYKKVEMVTQGDVSMLVKDGVLELDKLEASHISKEQIFAALRSSNIYHLGQIRRVYLEASGSFSIFKRKEPQPGMSVLPDQDDELRLAHPHNEEFVACCKCGNVARKEEVQNKACAVCMNQEWTYTIEDSPNK